ncbi:MAG: EAL domain-containing protein [Porticoccaceae bacterium]|nr:EAL domain-containing protein [Porticoccaceae bacterium]
MLNIRHQKNCSEKKTVAKNLEPRQVFEDAISETLVQEFRAPLGAMLGMLDLLLTTAMSLKQKEYLEVACSSGRSLMTLIDSVLTFSKIQAGAVSLVEQDCYLAEILDEVVAQLAEKTLKKSINLGYVLPSDTPPVVITDPGKLKQILIQLLDNAIKFTHFGEVSIYVELDKNTQNIFFIVKDGGIGIDKQHHKQIFIPFFQVNPASEKVYQGLGLGLTIANELSKIMKGQLSLTSRLGRGSIFKLRLPIQLVEEQAPAFKKTELINQKFLLVTRSPVIRDSVSHSIESLGGKITISNSSQDALKLFSGSELTLYSAVIIDEDLGDIPIPEFFGLLQDGLSFADTFALILSNPYFSSYHLDDLQVARLEKPLLSSSLTQILINQLPPETDAKLISALTNLDSAVTANVLVVEDNRVNQQIIEAMLIRLNCRHQVTSNGKNAVEKVVYGDFDLVLMDCNMPVLSGYAATRQIRGFEEQDAGKLPIIGMATNDTDRELCMSAGMSDVVDKPITLVDLRDLLSRWTFFPAGRAVKAISESENSNYKIIHRPPVNNLSYNPRALDRLVNTVGSSITNIIKDFCLDMKIYIQTLHSAISQNNESEICYIAHTLKGAARNFGAEQMVRLSAQLEEKVRGGEMQDIKKILPNIESAAELLHSDLMKEKESLKRQYTSVNHFDSKDLVLVVDDDRTSRVVLAEALRNSGCEVNEAREAKEALELCKRCMPDLILIDAIMPGLDGFDLCQTIRNMPFGADIPILIITASDSEDAVSMAFSVDATDFINKPVNTSVIQKRVNHLISSNKADRYMKQLAYHDSLTGLPNRTNLMQHLQLMIDQSNVEKTMFAVLFLDLDHFKVVNDTMGHDVGDLLLKAVADRLRDFLRGQDLIARLGGDEFTIVLQDVKSLKVIEEIAGQLCESFRKPFVFLRRQILVTTSIGISVFPDDGKEISDLLKHADTAMFKAKKNRDRVYFYKAGMESEISARLELQKDLRKAFDRDELTLSFQPKIDFKTGALLGAEALLRWTHPIKGSLIPNDFIDIAESTDLMTKMNYWVLQEGIKQLNYWLQSGHKLTLSLNISLSGSTLEFLYDNVSSIMQKYPDTRGLVELEITENALMCKPEKIGAELIKIKDLGVTIALDDFGSGYSSLNHLKEIPVDTLKIDRLFTKGIETNTEDQAIVKSIVNLANELNIETVAEGVETEGQKAILKQLNCHSFQGFLVSEPLNNKVFHAKFLSKKLTKKKKPAVKNSTN